MFIYKLFDDNNKEKFYQERDLISDDRSSGKGRDKYI